MLELMKKGFFIGLGALALTKETAEKLADDIMKKETGGKDKKDEVVDALLKKAKEIETEVDKRINEQVKKTLKDLGIPTEEEIKKLNKRIKALEEKIKTG
jgi:polyhydroxyalkanoate synthesis regulator phasin